MKVRGDARQARAIETRARLLTAGRHAFADLGHDGVNLKSDILDAAAVSVGSFYHQFEDKTALLVVVLEEAADEWRVGVVGHDVVVPGGSLDEGLRAAFTQFFAGPEAGEDLWRIHLRERANPDPRIHERVRHGRSAWRRNIAARFAGWTGAPEGYPERAAEMVLDLSIGLATTYLDRFRRERTAAEQSHRQSSAPAKSRS